MSDDINDGIKNTKQGMAIIGEIIKTAGDDPNVKEAGKNLGETAKTLTTTIKYAVMPLAALNFGIEKAHVYFKEKFQEELAEKADKISQEDIVEPKASIAGPALQGLAFTHEEESLKDMYLSLLATAMDKNTSDNAHPAFVEIIRQLTSEEANLVQTVLKSPTLIPICEIKLKQKGKERWISLNKHLINIVDDKTDEPEENERLASMVENWIRLGLVEVDYKNIIADETEYDWIETRPELERLRTAHENKDNEVVFQRGIIKRTAFGEQFAKAVDI